MSDSKSDAELLAQLDAEPPPAAPSDQRLATLASVGHAINSILEIDEVLDVIMDQLIALLRAERGFIMLVDGSQLTFRVARNLDRATLEGSACEISRSVVYQVHQSRTPALVVNAAADPKYAASPSIHEFGLRAILCVPMRIKDRIIGVIYLDNRLKLSGFGEEDLAFAVAFADQAALAIDNANLSAEQRRLRTLFEGYVSSEVMNEILRRGDVLKLGGERRVVTVMFCDIRGFTSLSERMDAVALVRRLNQFYGEMGEIIFARGGTLFSYMGDAIMAVFGAPTSYADDALRAVRTAMDMQKRMDLLSAEWSQAGEPAFEIGIGLCSGEVIVGDVGFSRKREYTVIGDTVNTAARLEKLNKDFHSRLVLSDSTRVSIGDSLPVERLGSVEVRGKANPLEVWTVPGYGARVRVVT